MTENTGQERGSNHQRQEAQEENVYHNSGMVPICKIVGLMVPQKQKQKFNFK